MAGRPRVLVTRPEPGASATAAVLTDMGFEPLVLPLSATTPLDVAAADVPADAAAATSAAALRHAPPGLLARLARLPFLAVGERTAEAARAAGFADVRVGSGDAARLAETATELLQPGARIAYLCGRARRPDFEGALDAAGLAVTAIETYDTLPLPISRESLRQISREPVDVVLVYSVAAAEALCALVEHDPVDIRPARFLCISPRVAAALGAVAGAQILCAAEPNEDAMTALLLRMAPAQPSARAFSAQAAMFREEGTQDGFDSTEPGMVKTTQPSRSGRDPVTIDLTAESIARPTDNGTLGSDSTHTGVERAETEADASAPGEFAARDEAGVTAAGGPDVATSAAEDSGAMEPDAGGPISGPDRPGFRSPSGSSAEVSEGAAAGPRGASASTFGRAATEPSADNLSRGTAGRPSADIPATPTPTRRAYRGTAFLAGLIGGALVMVIAGALQFAGLLPSPRTASAPPPVPEVVQAELAALRQDVADLGALRQEVARLQENSTAPSEAVQRLTSAVDEVRTELATLRDRPGGAAVDLGPLDARLTLLEKAVAELPKQDSQALAALGERVAGVEALVKSSGESLASGETRLAAIEQTLQALEQTVRGLTGKVDAQASQPKIARAIAASALKAAIDRGAPFQAELETLAAIVPQSPDLTALQAHAEKGLATEAQIAAEMPAAAKVMIAADQPLDQNAGFFDRLLDSAESMVEVRPIGAVAGAGVPETVARMEVAVNSGDLAAALAEYESLPDPAKAAGAPFAEKLRARVEAIRLADQAIAAAMAAG